MVTVGQLFAAMMIPTGVMLLGIVLDVICWRKVEWFAGVRISQ